MKKTEPALWGADRKVCDDAAQYPEYTLGRILSQEKDLYRMITAEGEYLAKVSGKFRYQAAHPSDFPAVGDFVMAGKTGEGTQAVIHQVLPRKSVFMRKAAGSDRKEQLVATNIDIVFLCMALNQDFNVRRLERYLSIAWDSGAKPVVVLTKSDICEDIEEKLLAVQEAAPGVRIIKTTALETTGIEEILPYLSAGTTAAFLGSSGVGKSTLLTDYWEKNVLQRVVLGMTIKGGIQRRIGNCCFYRMAGWSLIHRECVNLACGMRKAVSTVLFWILKNWYCNAVFAIVRIR